MPAHRGLVRGLAVVAMAGLIASPVPAWSETAPCDQQCQIDEARAAQQANALPLTDFYQVPAHLPPAPAGTLVRAERAGDYRLDAGMQATRILYHSRNSRDRDVVSSGLVLRPAGDPPPGGWPVIVNAHGASGINQACAPSLMRDIWYGAYLLGLVRAGYAVVATDYAGLGAHDGPAEFLSKRAEANDTFNALPAARHAVPGLGEKWVTLGHSQGGQAALAVDELIAQRRAAGKPEPGYRGAVAVAPASNLTEALRRWESQPQTAGLVPLLVEGAAATSPLRASDFLTPGALARLDTVDSDCLNVDLATYHDLTGDELVRRDREYLLVPFLRANEPATARTAGPILLQQGTGDILVTEHDTATVAARLRDHGTTVTYQTYKGLDHNGVLMPSLPDTLSWIAGRFG